MIRRPPRSTLFPYRNAFPTSADPRRRAGEVALDELLVESDRLEDLRARVAADGRDAHLADRLQDRLAHRLDVVRSEEHTSELQSRQYLVCRLLLEKKNTTLYI